MKLFLKKLNCSFDYTSIAVGILRTKIAQFFANALFMGESPTSLLSIQA